MCATFSAPKVIQRAQAMGVREEPLDEVPKPRKEERIYTEWKLSVSMCGCVCRWKKMYAQDPELEKINFSYVFLNIMDSFRHIGAPKSKSIISALHTAECHQLTVQALLIFWESECSSRGQLKQYYFNKLFFVPPCAPSAQFLLHRTLIIITELQI